MIHATAAECIEMTEEEMEALLERARGGVSEEDFKKLEAVMGSFLYVSRLVADEGMTLRKLREILLRKKSEKTRKVLERAGLTAGPPDVNASGETGAASAPPAEEPATASGAAPKPDRNGNGHGRNGAEAYRGADRVVVPYGAHKAKARCPKCSKGKLYDSKQPRLLVRVVGQAPLHATVYELQRLRCNLCGDLFAAEPPPGVGEEKYDATSASMIALLKYGTGLPFYRLERLQEGLGIPLPAATQWDIVSEAAGTLRPAFDELVRQAAQGDVLHNDDTFMRVLSLMEENEERVKDAAAAGDEDPRTGVFTSGIVATAEGRRIALFFTGRQHAGENLTDVLAKRAADRNPPIQMCDALSRNLPKDLEVILANCVVHGRRYFVDVIDNFPEECRHVLEALQVVYKNEAEARERDLSPVDRLELHRELSAPVMDELHRWMIAKLEDKQVEPNSGLGKAIGYMLRHWEKLTLFLRVPGAPLDNNICERALKKAILHRKNALFYKSKNGARVGDLFMSLIHTCELAQVDAFDYLTELLRHGETLAASPAAWMPWSYTSTLARPPTA